MYVHKIQPANSKSEYIIINSVFHVESIISEQINRGEVVTRPPLQCYIYTYVCMYVLHIRYVHYYCFFHIFLRLIVTIDRKRASNGYEVVLYISRRRWYEYYSRRWQH